MEWEQFLDPYVQAVGELKVKLRGIRTIPQATTTLTDRICNW